MTMPTGKSAKRRAGRNEDAGSRGRWPNINLIMIESADYGSVPASGKKTRRRNPVDEWILRIHIDVRIKDLDTYLDVRDKLAEGKRKEAHKILKDGGMLSPERPRAKALIKAALLDPGD
jgi:hypothetical protein